MTKWVYCFNHQRTEGHKDMANLLGGKGANLAEMNGLGLPIPPGFTLSTATCQDYNNRDQQLSPAVQEQCLAAVAEVAKITGKKFGDTANPLLFSIRSGARVSMPGMMDTVLNLGLNEDSLQGLIRQTGQERFAWDSYRRFIQMYANVVLGLNVSVLEHTLEDLKEARGVSEDTQLSAQDLQQLCSVYKRLLLEDHGIIFPLESHGTALAGHRGRL